MADQQALGEGAPQATGGAYEDRKMCIPGRSAAPALAYSTGARPSSSGSVDGGSRAQLLEALVPDARAALASAPLRSQERTWRSMRAKWFGSDHDCLPLTPESIRAVAAQI
eukprot:13147704-Alexandrium_andersonii.AAC.1